MKPFALYFRFETGDEHFHSSSQVLPPVGSVVKLFPDSSGTPSIHGRVKDVELEYANSFVHGEPAGENILHTAVVILERIPAPAPRVTWGEALHDAITQMGVVLASIAFHADTFMTAYPLMRMKYMEKHNSPKSKCVPKRMPSLKRTRKT